MNLKLNPEIAAAFVEEAKSYYLQIFDGLRKWVTGDAGALEEPRRLIHTIKGAASMVGLPAFAHASLYFEDSVKALIGVSVRPGDPRAEAAVRALDAFNNYVDGVAAGERRDQELVIAITALRRVRNEPQTGDAAAVRAVLDTEGPAHAAAPTAPIQAQTETMSEDLLANFRNEAEDLLLLIGRSLRLLQEQPANKEIQRALRRGVHTLKGAAQSVGESVLAGLCHSVEDVLDALIEGKLEYTGAVARTVFSAFDVISDIVTGEASGPIAQARANQVRSDFALVRTAAPAETAEAQDDDAGGPEDAIPPEFLEVFRPEADEHLAAIAAGLREISANPADRVALQDVRRAVHTLKGAAGVIGLRSVNTLAHRMEDLLDASWDGSVTLTAEHQQLLFATADVLTDLIVDPSRLAGALARRREILAQYAALEATASPVANLARPRTAPTPENEPGDAIDLTALQSAEVMTQRAESLATASRYVRVPIDRLDEMVRLVSELVVSRSTFEQYLDSYRHDIDEMRLSLSRLQRLSHRFDTDFEVQALLGGAGVRRAPHMPVPIDKRSEFDSLEFDRYTDLHLVSRDLGETTSDISVGVSQLAHVAGDFESYVNRMGRLTSDVQDRLMRMRMVPMATLASRLHRTVRVTAERLGKRVNLRLDGEDVEMDKTVLEELAGPLEHLLRNAIGHGIESADDRLGAGKLVQGEVVVRAYYAGTQVVVEVSDDGRGVEVDAVRKRALESGLISEAELAELDGTATFDLIFEPGFSTAAEVNEIAGRGVGLDVVKTAVQKLKGNTKVVSERGHGASFQIRLPMSIAILRVLMVRARGEVYAVPLASVSRIIRLEPDQLEKLGNKQVLRVGNRMMPAVRLDEALGGKQRGEDEVEEAAPRQPALIVDVAGQQAAVLVDELLLAREVVVKTLGTLVHKVHGVTGATILGDGGIVLIVNTAELFETQRASQRGTGTKTAVMRRARQGRQMGYDVLVIDDSVSVRRVLSNLFQNQGWRPIQARDGLEALEILQSGRKVDVAILDMEMPRMDGYELLALLRGQAQFASLPVIMLTSRAAEKHRRKAFELGANEFLVKPYQDESLLATINRVVNSTEALAG